MLGTRGGAKIISLCGTRVFDACKFSPGRLPFLFPQQQWQLDILNNIEFIPSAALYALG